MRKVKFKDMKSLVRKEVIAVDFVSDDGEFIHFRVLPSSPLYCMFNPFGEEATVVNGETVQEYFVDAYPQLFEDSTPTASVPDKEGEET